MLAGRFRFSFRTILIIVLVSLLVGTVSTIGAMSVLGARRGTFSLTLHLLQVYSMLVDQRIQTLLSSAIEESNVTLQLFESGKYQVTDFSQILEYWRAVMKVHDSLSYLSINLESTHELAYVNRLPDKKLAYRQTRYNPETGHLEARDYWPEDYPHTPFYIDLNRDAGDPTRRPWYIKAKAEGKPIWSETYLFLGPSGLEEVHGVSYATPIYDSTGNLQAVMTADFDVYSLCEYLKHVRGQSNGYAFIVELQDNGMKKVIAHPDPEILIRKVQQDPPISELVPLESLKDEVVKTFMGLLPDYLGPQVPLGVKPIEPFLSHGAWYMGGYCSLSSENTPNWLICMVIPQKEILGEVQRTYTITFGVGLGSLLIAIILSIIVAAKVSTPLQNLTRQVDAIGQLQLDPSPRQHSHILEIDRLLNAAEDMKMGLRSFQKYVPSELVHELIVSGEEARLGGHRQVLTVFFADIVNFTPLAEEMEPEDLVSLLSEYNEALSQEIQVCGGTLDKYMGDAIMAFWGAPKPNPQHPRDACRAAIQCQKRLHELRQRWRTEGKPLLRCRIGISTGELVVGNLGSLSRITYTVIGDTVNLASRLESLNGFYGTEILISENTYRLAEREYLARPVDRVSVKGKSEAVMVYELIGEKRQVQDGAFRLIQSYALALESYFMGSWEEAATQFESILKQYPGDGPSREMLGRCRGLMEGPVPEDWDGIHRMDKK